jgi:hypothetical protein
LQVSLRATSGAGHVSRDVRFGISGTDLMSTPGHSQDTAG